jgi:hypothetical protein
LISPILPSPSPLFDATPNRGAKNRPRSGQIEQKRLNQAGIPLAGTGVPHIIIAIVVIVVIGLLLSNRIVMMTNGPAATIGEVLDVGLARPRDRVVLAQDPLYTEYRSAVLEFLYHRQAHPATKEAA